MLGILGEGEVCAVYRAVADADGTAAIPVALAIVHPVVGNDHDAVEAFVTRSEAAVGFDHEHVAATLKTGKLEGRAYAVRELVDGATLAELLPKRSGLKPFEGKHVLQAVLEALAAAAVHSDGFVHGRLDMGDVLLSPEGEVRVCGFGKGGAAPGADLLSVARIAQRICKQWPPAVDAWIDRVQGDGDAFARPADALEALRAIPVDDEEKGAKKLVGRVKRLLKKRQPQTDDGTTPTPATAPPPSAPSLGDPFVERAERRSGEDRRTSTGDRRQSHRRHSELDPDLQAGIQQARWVAAVCGIAVLAAVIIEITRYVG